MKKFFLPASLIFVYIFALFVPLHATAQTSPTPLNAEDRLLVKFQRSTTKARRETLIKKHGGISQESLKLADTVVIKVPANKRETLKTLLKREQDVVYAEPDYVATSFEIPNDTSYAQQWGLVKIKAATAWDTTHGSDDVKIAIVDSGIDGSHPDVGGKIIARTNFTTDADTDVSGHGTHVAGIAAGMTNNGTGIAGIGYDTKLLSVKVLDAFGTGYYSWIANGIIWAADNNAKIINLSVGGSSASTALQDAVNYAWNKGAVVVAAAGNSNSSLPRYPGYYTNTIAVAATDQNDTRASFSNYGSWVDIAAPGVSILSTYKGGYSYQSGTSMATPFVSGLAGLVASVHPDWTNVQIRNKIESSTDTIPGTGSLWAKGRINACKAVDCGVTVSPTGTPIPTAAITNSPTPTVSDVSTTPTPTNAIIPSPTQTLSPTLIPTATVTPTRVPTPTLTPTSIPTPTLATKPWWCRYLPTYPGCS